jgi:L-ascorbate metabolism protein UlaG (beta-lactamase superfamily)
MRVRRLGWAGVEIEQDGISIVIDYLRTFGSFEFFLGPEDDRDSLLEVESGSVSLALISHLHRDHADPEGLAAALTADGLVLRPPTVEFESPLQQLTILPTERELEETGVKTHVMTAGARYDHGPFEIHATFASDGVGAPQVGWLVKSDEGTILHNGDTLWHGHWWDIPAQHGPIDITILPANAAVTSFPPQDPPANEPACLDPDQALQAARSMKAGALMPMHFNRTFEDERFYRPLRDAREQLEAGGADIELLFPELGEWIEVSAERKTPISA